MGPLVEQPAKEESRLIVVPACPHWHPRQRALYLLSRALMIESQQHVFLASPGFLFAPMALNCSFRVRSMTCC